MTEPGHQFTSMGEQATVPGLSPTCKDVLCLFFRMPDDVLAHICAVHQLPINLLLQTAVCCLSQVLFIHISFFV